MRFITFMRSNAGNTEFINFTESSFNHAIIGNEITDVHNIHFIHNFIRFLEKRSFAIDSSATAMLPTWRVPCRGSACINFPVSGPTKGSQLRNRCSIRRKPLEVLRCFPGHRATGIAAPTAPNTSSSSRGSTIGTPACTRICRPVYRPPRRQRGPSDSRTTHRAPPRSEEFPRTARRNLSAAIRRNTCTICMRARD